MTDKKAEDQLKSENGTIFNNKEKISSVLKTAVKEKLASMDCLIDDDLPNYIMIMMANRKTKKEMTEALTLFLNDRTEEFTTWLYQMLDNIRKRREKQKENDEKAAAAAAAAAAAVVNNNGTEKDDIKARDELEIGVGPEDDLDRELIGEEDKKSKDDKKSTRDEKKKTDKKPDKEKKNVKSQERNSEKLDSKNAEKSKNKTAVKKEDKKTEEEKTTKKKNDKNIKKEDEVKKKSKDQKLVDKIKKKPKEGSSKGSDSGSKKAEKPDLRKMLEQKRSRKDSDNNKVKKKKQSSSTSSSSSSSSESSDDEPVKKKKKKVDAKAKKIKKGKKPDKTKTKKIKKRKKDETSSSSESEDEESKNLKDLVIMVKNNETQKSKKKRRRKTREMRDKLSRMAKANDSGSNDDSQTEQSDKSKKAKKQRNLERKERSLLKQKKRLMRLHEKAKTGTTAKVTNDANLTNGVGNILYMPVDGTLQAVQIVQHQGMTMLAPVVAGNLGMAPGVGSSMAPPTVTGTTTKNNVPIFGQSAKINIESNLLPRPTVASATTTTSPLVTNSIGSNSFAALAQVPGSADVVVKDTIVSASMPASDRLLNAPQAKSPTKPDKVTDIDALKKKLAMMERETSRLRDMHKLRLKKLETKQRAQEELRKRDAEIQRRQDEEDARTVYVRNLHPKINEGQLREHFSMFGAIKRIVLPQDAHQIGSNRGFTFITFASKEPVEVACSLDGTLLHERSIKVVPKTNMMGKIRPQHLIH